MNIWEPGEVETISEMIPEDPGTGLLIDFRDTPGPVSPPFYMPDGGATQAFVRGFRTSYNIATASPGYDGTAWEFDQDAWFAPPTYPLDNPWVPAQGGCSSFDTMPTDYEWSGDFDGQIGEEVGFPAVAFLSSVYPIIPYWMRIAPLIQMSKWYENDDRWLSGPGRLRRKNWTPGPLEPMMYGQGRRWYQPDGAGVTPLIDEAFTVFSYYTLSLYSLQMPIFSAPTDSIFPLIMPPLMLFIGMASSQGGGIMNNIFRRRHDGQ